MMAATTLMSERAGRAGRVERGGSGTVNGMGCGLLERSAELAALQSCFDGAKQGAGTAVMVCGAAGTGKTSLVQTFLSSLDDEDSPTVLWGGCDDLIAPRAFGPFRDMINATGLLADELAIDPKREDLLVGLLGMLDRPSRPAVVVVEDAQWADDASIDVMRYLARRLLSLHAMLIVTARDDEVGGDHAVRGLLTGSSSSAPVRIDLAPLSLDAVKTIGGDSTLDPRYLHEISGGNPLLVRQLLSADPDDATRLARGTLMARTERLSAEGRSVLQALAVLPDGADPTLARTLFADRPAALTEAEGSGLLLSSPDHIRFRNELGRTAIIDAMSFGERMAATDRVLAALTETGEDPKVLVHIARAAGDGPRATSFALDALDHGLAPNDYHGVWALARIALECTTELSDERIGGLHLTAAAAGRTIGSHAEALRHAERAVQLTKKAALDDQRTLAEAWLTLADLQGDAGDHLRARTSLRTAKDLLVGDENCVTWARSNARQAAAMLHGGERVRSIEVASAGVELAEANGWTAELVHALRVRGVAAGGPATDAGLEDLQRARDLGATHGPAEQHLAATLDLAEGYLQMANSAEAEKLSGEVERACREHGLGRLRFRAGSLLARAFVYRGRTVEAEKLAMTLSADEIDPGALAAVPDAIVARVRLRRADEGAGQLVDQVWNMAVKTGEIEMLAFTGMSRLEHRWIEGDEDALRQFARYLAGLGERHRHHRLRAEALRALQRLGDEPALGGEDGAVFDGCPAPLAAALAGDHRLAAELWDDAGEPYARSLELIESSDAAIAFEGLRLLDRTGASRTADLARHRLRSRGLQGVPRGPRRTAGGGVPILTGRQIEVLKLIARGHTNAEIADELFVARRTVDNHVSAILSRLGVEGRSQAVDVAVSRSLIES